MSFQRNQTFFCRVVHPSIKTRLLWFTVTPISGGETVAQRGIQARVRGRPSTQGSHGRLRSGAWAPSSARSKNPGAAAPGSRGPGVPGSNRDLCQLALPRPPVLQFARASGTARAWGGASVLLFLWGPAPEGGADHAAGGPASHPLPSQLARLFVSNIRVSPLARLRGRGSGAILDSVQLPSPHPSPRSWPLRTRPLRPGPGPSPAALCLSRARPGLRPAAAPRPPRRPGARAEACVVRSGPEPGPAVRPLEPARCPGTKAREARGEQDRRKEREEERSRRRALRAPGAPRGPARGLRVSAGRRRGT